MPYGYLSQRVSAILDRLGRTADVHERSESGTDEFGNPTESYDTATSQVPCFRTYPNRNTEVSTRAGDRDRDRPLFIFLPDNVPPDESRLEYPEDAGTVEDADSTTVYEVQAPTRYDSHVEMFGELVVNP